jgi:hypothetical protein
MAFFSSIPYSWYDRASVYEGFYASIIYSLLVATGFRVIAEDITNKGRIDLTLIYKDMAYIFEFKVVEADGEGKALSQIKEKGYWQKYKGSSKKIYLIGMEFSKANRNIVSFDAEELR